MNFRYYVYDYKDIIFIKGVNLSFERKNEV